MQYWPVGAACTSPRAKAEQNRKEGEGSRPDRVFTAFEEAVQDGDGVALHLHYSEGFEVA